MAMNESKSSPPPARRGWLRKLGWLAGILVVLVVVAYFVLTSSAFLKAVVLPRVNSALNAQLAVAELGLSPFSQVMLRDVKVTPMDAEPLLSAGLVRVRYSLFALLGGKLIIEEATIESPVVTIVEHADGTSNLDPLLKQTGAKADKEKTEPASSAKSPIVDIKLVALKNATIRRIKETKAGRETAEISGLNITASNIKNAGSGKLDLSSGLTIENVAAGQTDTLQATLGGSFTFDLTADLKPSAVNGKATFAVQKAAGSFADAASLTASLDCQLTPTEVKQLALRFLKADATLAELRVSGPFDAAKSEGKLKVELTSLDRKLLNLFGATSGLDFGSTTVSAASDVELNKGGKEISLAGNLGLARFQVTRQGQTTPTLDLSCQFNLIANSEAQTATIKTLDILGKQNEQPLLRADLSSPMTIAWGNATSAVGDATLNLNLTSLNLADWRAFAADLAPAGLVNLKAKVLSQQAGKKLTFDLDGNIQNLGAKMGAQSISGADVTLTARGNGADLKQFKLDDFRLDLAQQGQSALNVSGNGAFDSATQDADLQVTVQAVLTRLLAMFPQPDAKFTGGTVTLKGRVAQKQTTQTATGQLALAGLNGSYGTYRFADFGSTTDLDIAMKEQQLEIRKASGELHEGAKPGGKFDISGNVNLGTKAGQLALKLVDLNQDGLRPFLESALGDKKLVSVSVNSSAAASFAANGDASVKGDFQLANLVVNDPKGSLPSTPLEAKAAVDASVAKSVAQIRQCQLTLTPTARAKNVLNLNGAVDFSKTNATTGNLKLASDSLDVTRYYDLFGDNTKTGETTAPTAPAPAPSDNKEPDPVKLPFRDFTFEAAIGRFYLREIDAQNVQLVAKLDGSRVLVKPAQLTLNGAPVSATADLDLSVPGYKYDVTFSANGIPVEPLANSFSPTYRGQAKGNLIASANMKGAGITGTNLRRTLNGNVSFSFTNANIQIVGPKLKKIASPIALVLGAPELLNSPLNFVNANLRAGNGNIEIPAFTAHSDAFMAESKGVIPIADVLTNSPLNQDVEVSLSRNLAQKLRFSNVPTNAAYMKLPTFVHLKGTLGSPEAKTDKAVIVALTASSIGGMVGGKAGGILEGVGAILGGKPAPAPAAPTAPATNNPPANVQQPNPVNDILNLFKKPKK